MSSDVATLYGSTLTQVAGLITGLDQIDGADLKGAQFRSPIEIEDEHGELIGFAVDEIGGVWAFRAATYEEYNADREKRNGK